MGRSAKVPDSFPTIAIAASGCRHDDATSRPGQGGGNDIDRLASDTGHAW